MYSLFIAPLTVGCPSTLFRNTYKTYTYYQADVEKQAADIRPEVDAELDAEVAEPRSARCGKASRGFPYYRSIVVVVFSYSFIIWKLLITRE